MTPHQQHLFEHWTKYLPMHFDYITAAIRSHFEKCPYDREVLKPLLDPEWLRIKQLQGKK